MDSVHVRSNNTQYISISKINELLRKSVHRPLSIYKIN